jgi:hypothetical protein
MRAGMSDRETFGIPGNRPLVSNAADPIPRKRPRWSIVTDHRCDHLDSGNHALDSAPRASPFGELRLTALESIRQFSFQRATGCIASSVRQRQTKTAHRNQPCPRALMISTQYLTQGRCYVGIDRLTPKCYLALCPGEARQFPTGRSRTRSAFIGSMKAKLFAAPCLIQVRIV